MDHLLVPIKVQALVIDELVINKRGALLHEGRYTANSGRWARLAQNYRALRSMLSTPAPPPFFGDTRNFDGKSTDTLLAPESFWPTNDDRGCYVHWVLPPGLRHAIRFQILQRPARRRDRRPARVADDERIVLEEMLWQRK